MAEENLEQQEQQKQPDIHPEDKNLIDEMQKIKENSVSKEEYDRVLKRNKDLSQALANNQKIQQEQVDTDTIESLREELYSEGRKEMTNLDSVTKMLKLRQKVIDSGKPDPFISSDSSTVTADEVETAERVAAGLQSMVDEADGNAGYFNALLKTNVDSTMPMRNKIRR